MRAIDKAAVERDGEISLMHAAGVAIASLVERYARSGPIVGVAGGGNNGGDTYATLAALKGRERIIYEHPDGAGSPARRNARERAIAAGVSLRPFPVDAPMLAAAGLLLDGVLGANARLPLDAHSAELAAAMNASGAPILALDIPTGIDPTTGAIGDPCVHATATIALGRPKRGCFFAPARDVVGDLWCATLGMRDDDGIALDERVEILTDAEFSALLPRRARESEKRKSGAPLIIAGSEEYPGAAVLCARGAARAGAGYVTVLTTAGAAPTLRTHLVEQVVIAYDEHDTDAALTTILAQAERASSIAIGPGLDSHDDMGTIVRALIERTSLPIVADAGAFRHLGGHLDLLRDRPIVLTPHANEFARLSERGPVAPDERYARLRAFVDERGVTTLLKGGITLIADRDRTYINTTGTSALATAGTGDVLTGIIATLLSQGLEPIDAARIGAYWHGRAGNVAEARRPVGVIAGDVYEALAAASVVGPQPEPFRIM